MLPSTGVLQKHATTMLVVPQAQQTHMTIPPKDTLSELHRRLLQAQMTAQGEGKMADQAQVQATLRGMLPLMPPLMATCGTLPAKQRLTPNSLAMILIAEVLQQRKVGLVAAHRLACSTAPQLAMSTLSARPLQSELRLASQRTACQATMRLKLCPLHQMSGSRHFLWWRMTEQAAMVCSLWYV